MTATASGAARTVLYVEHAGAPGGSCVSLATLLRRLDARRYRPIVLLVRPSEEMRRFYSDAGIEAVSWPGIRTLEHSTAEWSGVHSPLTWPSALASLSSWRTTQRRTLEAVSAFRPALVHLNSVVLYPSARALHLSGVPFVWHVREMPVSGHFGWRRHQQRNALTRWPKFALYLSESARHAWVGNARGWIAPEPVETHRFDPRLDRAEARRSLGIPEAARVILYVGGIARIKGILPLLEALARVRASEPRAVCLMPGGDVTPPRTLLYSAAAAVLPALGSGTLTQQVASSIERWHLESMLLRHRFAGEIERHLAASDLLVFPAVADHFARPIVEAGLMERPVVASDLPLVSELVEDWKTGLLAPPVDSATLAARILELLSDPELSARMGRAARARMIERFDAGRNADALMDLYDRVVDGRGGTGAESQ
ncbi:glycosyltransferase family 4 protein [Anaeromyxobacter sp. SG17]|uniref:glycosyltransferase family 4 protein n=1 Tax=Anaeromyxobacter sp. SG17 TaxID=2925405 RepID=UPI001F587251|nr:glycosyltransferase family 4 protein [Anaeromyxobacter sp. SG17]